MRGKDTCESVFKLLCSEGEKFGFKTVAVGELPGSGTTRLTPFFYSNWPQSWYEAYEDAGLVGSDPIVDVSRKSAMPLTWEELESDFERWQLSLDDLRVTELARDFARQVGLNWRTGLAVPVHGPYDYSGLVSWAGDPKRFDDATRAELHLVSVYAHNRMLELHLKTHGSAANIANAYGVSQREIEVLSGMAAGQSDAAIAATLRIAERTVQYHVTQAKKKLGCSTRVQLAVVATKLGLL